MPNLDCPNGDNCSNCMSKKGLWIPTFGSHTLEIVLAPKKLGLMFSKGGGWGGTSLFKDLKFIGWNSKTNTCGNSQAAITTNGAHSDYHPIAHM